MQAAVSIAVATGMSLLLGCATTNPQQRSAAAKTLFDQTTKQYHLPSADAKGAEHDRLLSQASAGYEQLLRQYRDQPFWCAQALRSLGNVRAEQGRLDDAVKLYAQVGTRYPEQDWEVLQAWKSAGDLLWDAGRKDEARTFYQKIVTRFEQEGMPAIVKSAVRGAKAKL